MILARFTARFHANRSVATTSSSIFNIIPYVSVSSKMHEIMKSFIFQKRTALSRCSKSTQNVNLSNKERHNSSFSDKERETIFMKSLIFCTPIRPPSNILDCVDGESFPARSIRARSRPQASPASRRKKRNQIRAIRLRWWDWCFTWRPISLARFGVLANPAAGLVSRFSMKLRIWFSLHELQYKKLVSLSWTHYMCGSFWQGWLSSARKPGMWDCSVPRSFLQRMKENDWKEYY